MQLLVKLGPQVVHHALPDRFEQHGLRVGEKEGQEQHAEEAERDPFEAVEHARRDVVVDGELRELRLRDAQGVQDERQEQRGREQADVGAQVAQEAARQPAVEILADGLFFVELSDCR
ncbi:MAG TPA: hypothetical protein VGV38_15440 [Pyrinomonadaceae bacterium]|nr:hypothetical protein [Pyrinomonadaceae bacterium]